MENCWIWYCWFYPHLMPQLISSIFKLQFLWCCEHHNLAMAPAPTIGLLAQSSELYIQMPQGLIQAGRLWFSINPLTVLLWSIRFQSTISTTNVDRSKACYFFAHPNTFKLDRHHTNGQTVRLIGPLIHPAAIHLTQKMRPTSDFPHCKYPRHWREGCGMLVFTQGSISSTRPKVSIQMTRMFPGISVIHCINYPAR
jgi:hypothetical protein